MEENLVKTTIRLGANFYEEVRIALAKRRIRSLQAAVEAGLRMWLDQESPRLRQHDSGAAAPGATKEEQAQVARFLDFLRCGDAGQVELVSHALDLHQKKQRRLRKPA